MDLARRTLCDVVAICGVQIADEPRRLENLLNDLCGEERRAIFVLTHAARARVPDELTQAAVRRAPTLQIERSARRLVEAYGFGEEIARWAVEAWALALGAAQPDGEPLTVCAQGRGRYRSIVEALRAAPPWSRIEVLPGTYTGPLVVDRPVELVALGRPGEVVLDVAGASGVRLEAEYALLRGLTISSTLSTSPISPTGQPGEASCTLFAVDVPQGELLMEDCRVFAGELAGVAVRGRAASVTLRRCHVSGARQAGVYVSLGGAGTLTDCDIEQNGGAGVEIGWQGSPVLRRCRVRGNGTYGIRIYAGGESAVEDCDLTGNRLGAWSVEEV